MAKRQIGFGLLLLLFSVISSLTEIASAQSIWIDRRADRAIWLEVQKPNFSEAFLTNFGFFTPPVKSTFATSAVFLSTRWRVSGPLLLRAEIPFVNVGFKDQTVYVFGTPQPFDGTSENQFGNPFVGIELGRPGASSFGEIGIRFPVVDDEHLFSSEIGGYMDFDRFESFLPNVWTFTAMANVQLKGTTGLLLRLRAGPTFFLPTESGPDPELFGDYSIQAGYQFNRVSLLGGLTGRGWFTETGLANRFIDQFGFAASYAAGDFIPGVHFRVPLDDNLSNYVDFIFGINVGYRLP